MKQYYSADRAVREIVRLVKGTIGEEKLMEYCNGIVKESCCSKPFSDGDIRALERAISELHRTLSSADTVTLSFLLKYDQLWKYYELSM